MVSTTQFTNAALSFEGTVSAPHFERTAFKVTGKRIFATLHLESRTANLKLSVEDQSVYALIDKKAIFPVDNKWGLQGWTTFQLDLLELALIIDALKLAHGEVFKASKGKKPR